ncbi:MAG: hypothetical protein HY931_02695 [Candidatus Falkowbacteria bacterium]|nr:MAG: hypothetical protein HY931_02695 [Candidatus Falkowbacteria bacterium]
MPGSNFSDNNSPDFSFKNMPRPQKTAVVILLSLGIVILFFGALQFRNRVVSPFQVDVSGLATVDSAIDTANKDTDSDGLSDYDEFNVYQTSPYLEDSDSDGLADNVEVKNGTDANCPLGQNCVGGNNFAIEVATGTDSTISNTSSTDYSQAGGLGTINVSSSTSETDLRNALAGQVDAPTLRQILLDNGADKAMLDAITDADLLKSYQEVLNNQ